MIVSSARFCLTAVAALALVRTVTRGSEASASPALAATVATIDPATKPSGERESVVAGPKLTPEEVRGTLNLGASMTDRGDFAAAEIAFRQVLNASGTPEHDIKTALLGLAHMHRKQGAMTKAAAIYESYLKQYPGDERTPDALLALGRTLRDLGVYKMALARFYNVINSTLKLPGEGFERYQVLAKTAQFEIAETHFVAGDFAEANKFYTRLRLLDLAPGDRARAQFKAAYSLWLQGELDSAVTSLRGFVEQWPDDENVPEARYVLAISLRSLGRTQEAFNATLELLRTEKTRLAADPKRWAYWQRRTGNQLANDFFETGDTLNARAIYAGLLELGNDAAWRLPITYQLGLCYERLGLSDRARASYRAIVESQTTTPAEEFAELARMAAWRIEHLDWREKTSQELGAFFETTTGRPVAATPSVKLPLKTAATP